MSSNANGKLRNKNDARLKLVRQKANDADLDAGDAKERATRNEQASVALTNRVRAGEPRWRLLDEATPELSDKLHTFAGQAVIIVPCGTCEEPEINGVATRLSFILGMAGWEVKEVNDPNALEVVFQVLVNEKANERTKRAANALAEELAKLPSFETKKSGPV
jgi:hypothetical protein